LEQAREMLPAGRELFFNSALGLMMQDGKRVMAKEITDADYYDTGNKLEYMKTAVAMAARHPEIGADFQQFLNEYVTKEK
jgi:UTP--glucose-1-phosphate uridylyltransferase